MSGSSLGQATWMEALKARFGEVVQRLEDENENENGNDQEGDDDGRDAQAG